MSKIEDLFRACTLSLPVTFLTGDKFDQISPSALSNRDLGMRLTLFSKILKC